SSEGVAPSAQAQPRTDAHDGRGLGARRGAEGVGGAESVRSRRDGCGTEAAPRPDGAAAVAADRHARHRCGRRGVSQGGAEVRGAALTATNPFTFRAECAKREREATALTDTRSDSTVWTAGRSTFRGWNPASSESRCAGFCKERRLAFARSSD